MFSALFWMLVVVAPGHFKKDEQGYHLTPWWLVALERGLNGLPGYVAKFHKPKPAELVTEREREQSKPVPVLKPADRFSTPHAEDEQVVS